MIMKMVSKFKVCTPKPDADLCMRVDLPPDKKKMWKIRTWSPGRRAAGPPGRRGPWAVGRQAFGPLGRRGLGQMNRGQVCWLALRVPESRLGVF